MSKNKTKNTAPSVESMDNYELSRWGALYHAVNMIAEVAEDRNTEFDALKLDQIALNKYVDEYSDDIYHRMTVDEEKKNESYSW